ncbi:hypothetical protein KM043_014291 [Ampulex compressa]|nr:hypothetical protein KM043_014291 [Ampulex compressa]
MKTALVLSKFRTYSTIFIRSSFQPRTPNRDSSIGSLDARTIVQRSSRHTSLLSKVATPFTIFGQIRKLEDRNTNGTARQRGRGEMGRKREEEKRGERTEWRMGDGKIVRRVRHTNRWAYVGSVAHSGGRDIQSTTL